jgi:hypothetical protein
MRFPAVAVARKPVQDRAAEFSHASLSGAPALSLCECGVVWRGKFTDRQSRTRRPCAVARLLPAGENRQIAVPVPKAPHLLVQIGRRPLESTSQ